MPGTVAVAVKRYELGKMSKWMHDNLVIGDRIELMGALGNFYYTPNTRPTVGLVAGGTGITPLFTLILGILTNPNDLTKISLVYCSSEKDILFFEELKELARLHHDKFEVHFTTKSELLNDLRDNLPDSGEKPLVVMCGPTGFISVCKKVLSQRKPAYSFEIL